MAVYVTRNARTLTTIRALQQTAVIKLKLLVWWWGCHLNSTFSIEEK